METTTPEFDNFISIFLQMLPTSKKLGNTDLTEHQLYMAQSQKLDPKPNFEEIKQS